MLTQVDLDLLLQLYFKAIDPTSLNRQGGDAGSQYRTGIFFTDPQDEAKARQALDELAKQYEDPIVVELLPLKNFYAAEDYHQDYWTNILTVIATSDPNFSNGRRKPTRRERRKTKLERQKNQRRWVQRLF